MTVDRSQMFALLGASALLFAAESPNLVFAADLDSNLEAHVTFLTSAELAGRAPGGPGEETLVRYLEEAFESAGLSADAEGRWSATTRSGNISAAAKDAGVSLSEGTNDYPVTNVIGILGDEFDKKVSRSDASSREVVVVGAHFDHLGEDGKGSYFPGADDNASGVAALLELARIVADEGPFARDILFVAFGAEEVGLLGSKAFVDAYPVENVSTMINLDAIGRMDERRLFVFGGGSGMEFGEILAGVNVGFGFDLAVNDTGPFASDQIPFYERGVPVLHFSTGANADYHRTSDTADKLNVEALSETVEFLSELVIFLAERDQRPTFVPPGAANAKPATAKTAAPRRVSLGTIPDFGRESGGVLLSGVTPGSPAAKAGLEKGDILISLGGAPTDNLSDFSAVLKSHQPGDEVELVALRGTQEIRATVVLAERKSRH